VFRRIRDSEDSNSYREDDTFALGFEGFLGSNMVTPRGLCSRMLFQLVRVNGIITKTSEVCSRLEKSVH